MSDDLTRSEAGRLLSVRPETIDRWADDGKIPFWTTPGGQRRFRREDIEAIRQISYNPAS